jgi:outer membrane protein OmpA-like peptidoglycan-associated protein
MHSICDVQPEVQQKTVQSLKDSELFEFDKASLTPPGMGKLDQFVADIKTKYKTKSQIEIVGYADRIGTPNYNMTLSQRRAAEVAIYLKKKFANDSKFQDIRLVS